MQFKAGYVVDSIAKLISDHKSQLNNNRDGLGKINGLLEHVISFDVTMSDSSDVDFANINPVLAVLNNIITRGLPTRAPVVLEQLFEQIGLTKRDGDSHELNYPECTISDINYQSVFELLHIIEPGLEITKHNYAGNLGSLLERRFIEQHPFLFQLLQAQRDFSTINNLVNGGRTVDFCFTSPYLHWDNGKACYKNVSRIFEIDGPHHLASEYVYYDIRRDDLAAAEGFETLRYTSVDIEKKIVDFEKLINIDVYQNFKKNYNRDIESSGAQYSLIFIPLAVARIQKTIIEYLLRHPELYHREQEHGAIRLAIIERDLPCGAIAVQCLQDMIAHINAMLPDSDKLLLPEIELTIFANNDWTIDAQLHLNANLQIEQHFKQNEFDIIIDHSILRRSGICNEDSYQHNEAIKVRSAHYADRSLGKARRTYCAKLLDYQPLVEKQDDGSYEPIKTLEEHINYFIRNIFRKEKFREGQLPIISRALQQKPVIGLLPTGGGKSLTFQLPAFLQPGLCLVVDPIKSLMQDQVRVLKENWIDCCDYINSNLEPPDKKKRIIDFLYGETMFLFISPERFVMNDFRQIIRTIDVHKFRLAFSYCVIDEVHCVSEWGHDFRSTYLMLGKNAQTYAKTKNGNPVSLIGLTATASFDVLADIERELHIQHDDVANAIIMIENTIRPELFFRVIDVTDKDRMAVLNEEFGKTGNNLKKINTEEVLKKSQRHHFDEFDKRDFAVAETRNLNGNQIEFAYNNSFLLKSEMLDNKDAEDFYGIIFCPVKGRRRNTEGEIINENGVDFVFHHLNTSATQKGYYYGADNDEMHEDTSTTVQANFENFTTGKIKHIVCTKAFGMGIDKKDIRTTYHHFYSGSLESLVQESGRSGRDKKISQANILVSTTTFWIVDVYALFAENKDFKLLNRDHRQNRKAIRLHFQQRWNDEKEQYEKVTFHNLEAIEKEIRETDFATPYYTIDDVGADVLREKLLEKDDTGNYKYIKQKYADRGVHDYFYSLSFKGIDTEKSQLTSLFNEEELPEEGTLKTAFAASKDGLFYFSLLGTKKTTDKSNILCGLLQVNPLHFNSATHKQYAIEVVDIMKYAHDFDDYIATLEEKGYFLLDVDKTKLYTLFYKDRETPNDTGRLIYRMHSMGFLIDYEIAYNIDNLYKCTFRKHATIDPYIKEIEKYLRRYSSEQQVILQIKALKQRLTNANVADDIIECLNFLTEFSYEEIAGKRQRATTEIEDILLEAINKEDWYDQNIFLKEQIYFYFNAKYARKAFKINGNPYSLLDDYQMSMHAEDNSTAMQVVLNKYLTVYGLDGAEQNNYKHMIGSCKKILRSLSEKDLDNEWMLRLLKAFAMYSVNNRSYISEANAELEAGFDKLYKSNRNDFVLFKRIMDNYFRHLLTNINPDNESFTNINVIRLNLLLKLQNDETDRFLNDFNI